MSEEGPFQDYSNYAEVENTGKKSKAPVVIITTILVIIAIVAGLYFLGQSRENGEVSLIPLNEQAPTSAPVVDPTATPTEAPDLDRSELTVDVLNGSGTAGAAGDMADIIEDLGYTLGTTGNADNFDYEGITVNVSEESKDYLELLLADLKEKVSGTVTGSVSASLTTGAEVIVGQ